MKVLLVDQSDECRRRLYTLVRDVPGATVVGQASDERQATVLAALCKPDLILTDLDLGRGCGFSLIERLQDAGYEGAAYLVTAADETVYGPRCVDAGITGFYNKTHDLGRLAKALGVFAQAPVSFSRARLRAEALL
ncbi:response regulator [Roseateles chitinivorans]|uniref:response regulator n=1 Tax=Roseateles chitinivorans TaxID=2917965 RepID=UPI003D663C68